MQGCGIEHQDAYGIEPLRRLDDLGRLGRSRNARVDDLKAITLENLKEYSHGQLH
jgi:hypothetical protein